MCYVNIIFNWWLWDEFFSRVDSIRKFKFKSNKKKGKIKFVGKWIYLEVSVLSKVDSGI